MTDEPEETLVFTTEQRALLVACAIVGLWLVMFAIGYDVGRDLGHGIFGIEG